MKIKELVEELRKYDQELEVLYYSDDGGYEPCEGAYTKDLAYVKYGQGQYPFWMYREYPPKFPISGTIERISKFLVIG